jgi:reverse gyrase
MEMKIFQILLCTSISSSVLSFTFKTYQNYNKLFSINRFYSSTIQRLYSKKSDSGTILKTGKVLVIVESPSKARTIQKFLDPERYIVDSSVGHVRELIKSTKELPDKCKPPLTISHSLGIKVSNLGINVNNNFEPIYCIKSDKREIIKRLKSYTKSCSSIIFATDEDREGESFFFHSYII